jgi:hypothetical protein
MKLIIYPKNVTTPGDFIIYRNIDRVMMDEKGLSIIEDGIEVKYYNYDEFHDIEIGN